MARRRWPRIAAFTLILICATGVLVAAGLAEETARQADSAQQVAPADR